MHESLEDNPYRFIDVGDGNARQQRPASDPAELRAYVRPDEEPILSPREIRRLGHSRTSLGLRLFMMWPLWGLALALNLSKLPRDDDFPSIDELVVTLGIDAFLFILCVAIAVDVFLLARTLRYSRFAAAMTATIAITPVVNLCLLLTLATPATRTLRRHGIPANFWGPHTPSLPTRRAR